MHLHIFFSRLVFILKNIVKHLLILYDVNLINVFLTYMHLPPGSILFTILNLWKSIMKLVGILLSIPRLKR